MKIIGLTGGIGSGKSTVGQIMVDYFGVTLLMTDEIGRLCMEKGQACYFQIVELFGEEILTKEKELDRQKLSSLVFADAKKLQQLNAMVHPCVKAYILEEIKKAQKEDIKYLVIESAILIEAGYEDICEEYWYVSTSKEQRSRRLKESRGYSDYKIEAIIKNQKSEEFFMERCDKIIHNDGSLEEVRAQLENILV